MSLGGEEARAATNAGKNVSRAIDRGTGEVTRAGEQASGLVREEGAAAGAMFDPYAQAGRTALSSYLGAITPGGQTQFTATPIFDFQRNLMNRQLAALGKNLSPSSVSAGLTPLIQQESERQLGRLSGLINMGYSATGQQAGAKMSTANQLANIIQSMASQRAQGGIASAQARSQGFLTAAKARDEGLSDMLKMAGGAAAMFIPGGQAAGAGMIASGFGGGGNNAPSYGAPINYLSTYNS